MLESAGRHPVDLVHACENLGDSLFGLSNARTSSTREQEVEVLQNRDFPRFGHFWVKCKPRENSRHGE